MSDIAPNLPRHFNDLEIDADGGAILPGLHDHHLHLLSLAERRNSVDCGPPRVKDASELERVLRTAPNSGWIRGVGYHESVAGDLTSKQLDQWVSDRPIRIQHRSGRLWYLNTLAMHERDLTDLPDGQLYRRDHDVRDQTTPSAELLDALRQVSGELASYGVTHVTDATPSNDDLTAELLRKTCVNQTVRVMGSDHLSRGHLKIILDDYQLPEIDAIVGRIRRAHRQGRPVAIHCVSRLEIVFALACIRAAGIFDGDRLEHATELSDDLIEQVLDRGLKVVPNPNFIYERGDDYIRDNDADVVSVIFRLREMYRRAVNMVGGTDAPFGDPDPWVAIKAATNRRTRTGTTLNWKEAINPEQSLRLFLSEDVPLKSEEFEIHQTSRADFCILNRPWQQARLRLTREDVRATVANGVLTYFDGDVPSISQI